MISMEKNFNKRLLTALLIGAVGSAIAGTPCGTNLEYELDGTTLVLTSPDPTQAATINSQAFMGRMDFTDVVIPDNVTEINTRAFKNCTALTSVVIPPSVTLVGEQAFYDCSALVSVLCRPTSAPTLVADAFTGCHASLQICVPKLGGTDGYNSSDWNTSYGEKLNLCFLDERDDEETTAGQISTFRTQSTPAVFLFRTLRKAGCFNTLTLPFNVSNLADSPLGGDNVEVYTFTDAAVENGTLVFDITKVNINRLEAGVPYLIQWNNTGEVITRMDFTDIDGWDGDNTAETTNGTGVTYHGFYGKTHISDDTQGEQHLNLFLGGGNQLYWPSDGDDANAKMLGFRAWFRINGSSVSGAPVRRGMPAMLRIVATPTAINETAADPSSLQGGDRGRLILRNGQLVIIRNGQTFSLNGQKL